MTYILSLQMIQRFFSNFEGSHAFARKHTDNKRARIFLFRLNFIFR